MNVRNEVSEQPPGEMEFTKNLIYNSKFFVWDSDLAYPGYEAKVMASLLRHPVRNERRGEINKEKFKNELNDVKKIKLMWPQYRIIV
jgi:hypothetical protein